MPPLTMGLQFFSRILLSNAIYPVDVSIGNVFAEFIGCEGTDVMCFPYFTQKPLCTVTSLHANDLLRHADTKG